MCEDKKVILEYKINFRRYLSIFSNLEGTSFFLTNMKGYLLVSLKLRESIIILTNKHDSFYYYLFSFK